MTLSDNITKNSSTGQTCQISTQSKMFGMNLDDEITELTNLRFWLSCNNDYFKNGQGSPSISSEGVSIAYGNVAKRVLTPIDVHVVLEFLKELVKLDLYPLRNHAIFISNDGHYLINCFGIRNEEYLTYAFVSCLEWIFL